jgi:hypothetical protein
MQESAKTAGLTFPEATVEEHAAAIRHLTKRIGGDMVEVGLRLIAVKAQLGHGQFTIWLQEQFAWSEATARRMMRVAETFAPLGGETGQFDRFAPSAMYALAAGSMPDRIRGDLFQRAASGEDISLAKVHAAIDRARPNERRRPSYFLSRTPQTDAVEATMAPSDPDASAVLRLAETSRYVAFNVECAIRSTREAFGGTTGQQLAQARLAASPHAAAAWEQIANQALTLLYLLAQVGIKPSHAAADEAANADE